MKEIITLKKEKEEATLIGRGLDAKLSTALAKAEQINAFQIEKRDMEDRIKSFNKQIDTHKNDAEKKGKEIVDLKKKLEEEKKKAAERPVQEAHTPTASTPSNSGRPNIKARPINSRHSSKQSRANHYFATLQMSGGFNKAGPDSASHQRQMSQYNTTQMMQQMQNTEDVYMSII